MSAAKQPRVNTPRLIAIDTDPGVDDALALMLAFRSPEIQVPLITTVAGNVPVAVGTKNLGRLLNLISPKVWPAIAQGAARPLRRRLTTAPHIHGDDGLGGATLLTTPAGRARYPAATDLRVGKDAPGKLAALARKHGRELCIVALGPLTNIARAISRDPDAMLSIARLVIMGGAIRAPGNVTPTAEFNIHVDPDAAAMVVGSGINITLVPLDVTRQVKLDDAFLRGAPNTSFTRATKAFTQDARRGRGGISMHDPLAVAVAIEPDLVRTESLAVRVETEGRETLGMTVADRRPSNEQSETEQIAVATGVNAQAALTMFRQRVLESPRKAPRNNREGKVLVVGSANIDLSVTAPGLPSSGETVLGTSSSRQFGGKGANQAIAARRAGSQVALVAKVGADDFGREYQQFLVHEEIDAKSVTQSADHPTGLALIVVDTRGENQIAVASGANMSLAIGDLPDFSKIDAGVLVVQLECPLPTVAAALHRGKKAGLMTVMNPAPASSLPDKMLHDTDVLVANEVEAELLSGITVASIDSAGEAARVIQDKGVGNVLVTLGKQGSVCLDTNGKRHHVKARRVKAVDTTAAGDTFIGYLASALADDRPLLSAIELATHAAGLSVTRQGAVSSIPHAHDL